MAGLKSLDEIFNNTLFRIPDYQRGYAWTVNQLDDFWDDLYNLHENKDHYTGVLTVKGITIPKKSSKTWIDEKWLIDERGYKAFYVVDGQQRLTTSLVLIQVICELIKKQPANINVNNNDIIISSFTLQQIVEKYIQITKLPERIIRTYKFGYETDNPSFRFLRHKIFNEPFEGSVEETFYTLNLENAKRFFEDKLKRLIETSGENEISLLYKKLTVNMKYNFYEIEEDFDVFVAFETMNNRGKKLSNLELLKNRLVYLSSLYEYELDNEEKIVLRKQIDHAWKEVYHHLGKNKKFPLADDDFLVAHWIMYFQYTREKGDDYIKFLLNKKFTPKNIYIKADIPVSSIEAVQEVHDEQVDEDYDSDNSITKPVKTNSKLRPIEIKEYVNSLQTAVVHWYNTYNPLNNPDLTDQEQVWIDRLNRIGISYFRPLITASFMNSKIKPHERIALFKAIERFIFIAFRLGRAFANYRSSEFYRAARELIKNELTVKDVIAALEKQMEFTFLRKANGEIFYNPKNFQVYIERHFKNGGGYYRWNGLRYFLYEYELEKVEKGGNKKIDWDLFVKNEYDTVSIEHILPQTADNKSWKNVLKGLTKEQVEICKNTLGNLLPLSQSINASLQNDSFNDKKNVKLDGKGKILRRGYQDGSHSEIEVAIKSTWTSTEILERGLDLLSFMERRWKIRFMNEESKYELLGFVYDQK